MSANAISTPQVPSQAEDINGPSLAGWRRTRLLIIWGVVMLVSLAAFFWGTYLWFRWDSTPIAVYDRTIENVTQDTRTWMEAYQANILKSGMSLTFYGGLFAGLRLIACIPFFVLSLLIVRQRSRRLMAVVFAIILADLGAAGNWFSPIWNVLPETPQAGLTTTLLIFLIQCSGILLYMFPDGRFVPRWTRWLGLFVLVNALAEIILAYFTPWRLDPFYEWLGAHNLPMPITAISMLSLFAFIYRYARSTHADQKRVLKWFLIGAVLVFLPYYVQYIIYNTPLLENVLIFPGCETCSSLLFTMTLQPFWYVCQVVFAVCIFVTVFRRRLWNIGQQLVPNLPTA
jgi:hypothetical protein